MSKTLERIFSTILNMLLVIALLILIVFLYNYVRINFLKKDFTNIFGYAVFQVASGSMEKTLKIGDIIIVKLNQDNKELKNGDIIVFKQNKSIITHRIVNISEKQIFTKGDANNTIDDPITPDKVIGKVIKIFPNIVIWQQVFTSPKVIVSFIITIIFFGITLSINEKTNVKKEEDEDND